MGELMEAQHTVNIANVFADSVVIMNVFLVHNYCYYYMLCTGMLFFIEISFSITLFNVSYP